MQTTDFRKAAQSYGECACARQPNELQCSPRTSKCYPIGTEIAVHQTAGGIAHLHIVVLDYHPSRLRHLRHRYRRDERAGLRGYLDMLDRRWDAAEKSLAEAIRLTPYLTRPHFNLAMVHYERGEINAADKELAFALRYDSPELAVVHRAQGERKKSEVLGRKQSATSG